MPNPTRSVVKDQVCAVLAVTAENFGIPRTRSQIEQNEDWILIRDLGLGAAIRRLLSTPYSRVSESYEGGLRVYRDEAKDATTVRAAIDLVHKRAKGERE